MGSDLTFEDLSNRHLAYYNYNRLDDEIFDNSECFVLESPAKKRSPIFVKQVCLLGR